VGASERWRIHDLETQGDRVQLRMEDGARKIHHSDTRRTPSSILASRSPQLPPTPVFLVMVFGLRYRFSIHFLPLFFVASAVSPRWDPPLPSRRHRSATTQAGVTHTGENSPQNPPPCVCSRVGAPPPPPSAAGRSNEPFGVSVESDRFASRKPSRLQRAPSVSTTYPRAIGRGCLHFTASLTTLVPPTGGCRSHWLRLAPDCGTGQQPVAHRAAHSTEPTGRTVF